MTIPAATWGRYWNWTRQEIADRLIGAAMRLFESRSSAFHNVAKAQMEDLNGALRAWLGEVATR